jgi:hypothetical protein
MFAKLRHPLFFMLSIKKNTLLAYLLLSLNTKKTKHIINQKHFYI